MRPLPIVLCLSALIGNVSAAELDPEMVEARLLRLERLTNAQNLLEQEAQRTQLQRDIQALRGESEVLNHKIELLKKQAQDNYLDVDQRLRQTQNQMNALSTAPSTPPSVPNTAPQNTLLLGNVPTPPMPEPAVVPANNLSEEQSYQQAFKAVQEGHYEQASTALEQYLQAFPKGSHSDNAQYWLGEAYYAQKKYNPALASFNALLDKYPDSGKRSSALLKMGSVYYEMKDKTAARAIWERVRTEYPNTATARLAGERLQKLRGEGQ
ncbi:MAG: tol-pal system protein YbgF [Thiotrichaceae bacterium]|nr:tol-pal system protein YbgF [Thiotrichaceae bacterium]